MSIFRTYFFPLFFSFLEIANLNAKNVTDVFDPFDIQNQKETVEIMSPLKHKLASNTFPFSFEEKNFYIKPYVARFKDPKTNEPPHFVSYQEFLEKELKTDWDIRRKKINVEQVKKGILLAISNLLPKLTFTFVSNYQLPVDLLSMLKGLYGFLIPSNWFQLFAAHNLAISEKFAYMDLLLNKYLLADISYINVHKAKWELNIYEIYSENLGKFIERVEQDPLYSDNDNYLQILKAFYWNLKKGVAARFGDLNEKLPLLAKLVNITDTKEINNFQIRPIRFPRMENLPGLNPYPYEKLSLKHSLTLKVIEALRNALRAKVGVATLSGTTTVADANKAVGFTIGLNNPVAGLIAIDDVRKLQVNYEEVEADIKASIVVAAHNYNRTQVCYQTTKRAVREAQKALEDILVEYEQNHYININLHDVLKMMIESLEQLNACFHLNLIVKSTLKRYLVTPSLLRIHNILPDAKIINPKNDKSSFSGDLFGRKNL